jgi:peptidoglycan-associated lipoprotein
MRNSKWLTALALTGATLLFVAGCKKKPPTTTPQEAPPPAPEETVKPTPPPAPPEAPPKPEGVMSEDIQTLNAKGYLKDAFYDFDKADLRDDAREALAADAGWLKRYSGIQVVIEGHCDERGTEEYNLALGQRRASAAHDYLVSLGVDGSRIKTVSYGKDRPFCTEHDEACWQQNRRAHFVITSK